MKNKKHKKKTPNNYDLLIYTLEMSCKHGNVLTPSKQIKRNCLPHLTIVGTFHFSEKYDYKNMTTLCLFHPKHSTIVLIVITSFRNDSNFSFSFAICRSFSIFSVLRFSLL